jgi:excisionase family DNA binding protein
MQTSDTATTTRKPWWTPQQLAEHLQVSVQELRRLVAEGKIPAPLRLGARTLRFDPNAIDAHLAILASCGG